MQCCSLCDWTDVISLSDCSWPLQFSIMSLFYFVCFSWEEIMWSKSLLCISSLDIHLLGFRGCSACAAFWIDSWSFKEMGKSPFSLWGVSHSSSRWCLSSWRVCHRALWACTAQSYMRSTQMKASVAVHKWTEERVFRPFWRSRTQMWTYWVKGGRKATPPGDEEEEEEEEKEEEEEEGEEEREESYTVGSGGPLRKWSNIKVEGRAHRSRPCRGLWCLSGKQLMRFWFNAWSKISRRPPSHSFGAVVFSDMLIMAADDSAIHLLHGPRLDTVWSINNFLGLRVFLAQETLDFTYTHTHTHMHAYKHI